MVSDPITGTGPDGKMSTARETFLRALAEVDAEWELQSHMTQEQIDKLEKDLGFRGAHDYLNARLNGSLKTLYLCAKRLPPALFTIELV